MVGVGAFSVPGLWLRDNFMPHTHCRLLACFFSSTKKGGFFGKKPPVFFSTNPLFCETPPFFHRKQGVSKKAMPYSIRAKRGVLKKGGFFGSKPPLFIKKTPPFFIKKKKGGFSKFERGGFSAKNPPFSKIGIACSIRENPPFFLQILAQFINFRQTPRFQNVKKKGGFFEIFPFKKGFRKQLIKGGV